MGFYKALSVAAFGMASYALYKSGALNPAVKCAVKVSKKASDFADENIAKAKDGYKNLVNKFEKEEEKADEVITAELVEEK